MNLVKIGKTEMQAIYVNGDRPALLVHALQVEGKPVGSIFGLDDYKSTVYDIEWQCIRMRVKGDWFSAEGVHNALRLLDTYLAEAADNPVYLCTRQWRVLNLINATWMGVQDKSSNEVHVLRIREYKDNISKSYEESGQRGYKVYGLRWTDVHTEWTIPSNDLKRSIFSDLFTRFTGSMTRWSSGDYDHRLQRSLSTRPELAWFLLTVEKEQFASRMLNHYARNFYKF